MNKKFPILYKYTTIGTIQQWQIVVENDCFWTIEGLKGGKLTQSEPTICLSKNVGRSNETLASAQALKEAAARHTKKINSGYNEVLSAKPKFFEPMLAQKLEDREKLLFTVPTFISPKLDGCLSSDTLIQTDQGEKSIGEIVENRTNCEILTYNTKTKQREFKKIANFFKNAQDIQENTTQWYKIELSNGKTLKITGNHRVYLPRIKAWRRVDELKESDILMIF